MPRREPPTRSPTGFVVGEIGSGIRYSSKSPNVRLDLPQGRQALPVRFANAADGPQVKFPIVAALQSPPGWSDRRDTELHKVLKDQGMRKWPPPMSTRPWHGSVLGVSNASAEHLPRGGHLRRPDPAEFLAIAYSAVFGLHSRFRLRRAEFHSSGLG